MRNACWAFASSPDTSHENHHRGRLTATPTITQTREYVRDNCFWGEAQVSGDKCQITGSVS